MKTITTNNRTIVVLEDSEKNFHYIINSDNEIAAYGVDENGNPVQSYRLSLPEGKWSILGTISAHENYSFSREISEKLELNGENNIIVILENNGIELPKKDNKLLILIKDKQQL